MADTPLSYQGLAEIRARFERADASEAAAAMFLGHAFADIRALLTDHARLSKRVEELEAALARATLTPDSHA